MSRPAKAGPGLSAGALALLALAVLGSPAQLVRAQPVATGIQAVPRRLPRPPIDSTGISVAAVGDIMLGSWVTAVLNRNGVDYPFQRIAPQWSGSDLVFGNLEAPFTEGGTPFEKTFTFRVPLVHAAGLRRAGFTLLSLANNHIMDYGEHGLLTTLATLEATGIAAAGAGPDESSACAPVFRKVGRRRVALLAYSLTFPVEFYARQDTAGTCFPFHLEEQVAAARESVDYVIVSFHWGAEKRATPKPYQIEVAHRAIDAGADLVLGHHPHVLQGLEVYRNRLIAYSLGNFAFGSYSSAATVSLVLKAFLNRSGLVFARCIPINVDNVEVEFQPRPLTGSARDSVLTRLGALSRALNNGRDLISPDGIVLGDDPAALLPARVSAPRPPAVGVRTAAP